MNCENCFKKEEGKIDWTDFKLAVPLTVIFIVLFYFLQKLEVVNLADTTKVNYGTALVIGLMASVSSCLAVVGGLVLSLSASFAKAGDKIRPQVLFHLGRLVSFFILGGVIGWLGSAFQLSANGTFIVSFTVAVVLIILGLNLLDIFPWAKKLQLTLPVSFINKIETVKSLNHSLTPILVGVITFFLPCGFTQSMQIYTLSTGSFWTGAFTMLVFALGTLPVLLILSFSSVGIYNKTWSGVFFKTAGLLVIFFGLFNLTNSLKTVGFDFSRPAPITISTSTSNIKVITSDNVYLENGIQIVELKARGGYSPRQSVAQAGLPTIIRFETAGTFDCSASVRIPSKNISLFLKQNGKTDVSIGTSSVGLFRGSCGMGMYPFEIDFR